MKSLKVLSAVALAGAAGIALASCGGGKAEKVKIFLGVQQDNDPSSISTFRILDSLKDELNFEYDYKVLNARDSVANLNEFNQRLDLGYKGIISMADLDTAQAEELIDNCETNQAFYVGYKSDMPNAMRSDKVKNSPYYLGSTSDGELDWSLRAQRLFDSISKSTDRKIVLASFAANYFPNVTVALNKFKGLVTEWNASHPDDQFTYGSFNDGADTWTCKFGPLADAEKTTLKNEGVEAIVAVNAVAKYVMPNLDPSVHVYNVGYDSTYDNQFGADKQLRCQGCSPADHIILPLIRILKAVNGANAIKPENKIVVGNYIYMQSADDLAKLSKVCINFKEGHPFDACLFTVDQAKSYLDKSDDELIALTNSWTTEYVLGLNK